MGQQGHTTPLPIAPQLSASRHLLPLAPTPNQQGRQIGTITGTYTYPQAPTPPPVQQNSQAGTTPPIYRQPMPGVFTTQSTTPRQTVPYSSQISPMPGPRSLSKQQGHLTPQVERSRSFRG